MRPGSWGTRAVVVACVLALSMTQLRVQRATPAALRSSSCFGAAARAPGARCARSPNRFSVVPTPYDAPLEPSERCTSVQHASVDVCRFGRSPRSGRRTLALIGDSHAVHWRAALAVAAAARRWAGISITRSTCPYTFAVSPRERCGNWAHRVLAWVHAHPGVHTIVVSANSGSGVLASPAATRRATKIRGYQRAWKALPRTVTRIIVIRDVPHARTATRDCVAAAVAHHRDPAVRCARPRSAALRPDLEALAATMTDSRRVRLVDLTPFMCDARLCYPVVGGVLVIKDIGHLTRTFSRTLGPFLGAEIQRAITARAN
jgi:SGNH domain (fused to AT3 domains)